MSLFDRISETSPPLKSQARETGVPLKILKKVHDRGVKNADAELPDETKEAWGQARVADFVRGGASREKDSDLWKQYHKEDAERADQGTGALTAGVFIPLPDTLARYFPKKAEDDSVPHITMLFVGPVTADEMTKLVAAVQDVAKRWPPFRMDLAAYNEFVNKEGQTIAHMVPSAAICLSSIDDIHRGLADLHADLYAGVEEAGVPIKHSYKGEPGEGADYFARVEAFKPHATLAYVDPGGSYTGPKPTGSFYVTELEIWGQEKYRVPLGLSPQMTPVQQRVEDEDDEALAEEIVVPAVTVSAPRHEVGAALVELNKKASPLTQAATERLPAEAKAAALGAALDVLDKKTTLLTQTSLLPVLEQTSPPVQDRPPVRPPVPEPPRRPMNGIHFFEAHGHLSESVLDFGPSSEHDYARLEDEGVLDRRWKTIVVTNLAEQQPSERLHTLLAARGLLAKNGKILVSIPQSGDRSSWDRFLGHHFESKMLTAKNLWAWQLTPRREFLEQAPEAPAPIPQVQLPAINLPAINLGPVILKIPERQVQVHAPIHAPITAPITIEMPEQAPPQVKVDVHPPPALKKKITMTKDMNGRVTGELEMVEEQPVQRPAFPTDEEMNALLNDNQPG